MSVESMRLVFDPHEMVVPCAEPGCGCQELHPVKVEVNRGGEVTTVVHDGTSVNAGRRPSGRGVGISVYFQGECGHVSRLDLQFHKGSTYIHSSTLGILCGPDEDGSFPFVAPNIWRD